MFILTIEGNLPSLNEYIDKCRSSCFAGNEFKKKHERKLIPLFRSQTKQRLISDKVWIDYIYYCKDKRKDLDNIAGFAHKVIQDSLVKGEILKNDGWEQIAGFSDIFRVDKDHPRIEIAILPMAERRKDG